MTRSSGNSSLDNSIESALSSLKDQFFLSISSSTASSFECFSESYSAFEQTVHSVYDQLQQETLALVYSFASTVSIVASSVVAEEKEAAKLFNDCLDKLTLDDNDDGYSGSHPQYLSASYQWLLQNLHNPYPPKEVRDTIARKANCSRKDVDSWFIDARKRIGWNAVRKSCFSNKRSDIIEAAYRFFVEEDPKRPLTSDVELQFATIETLAKDMYSDKLAESTLAMKLDSAVKDMTFEMRHQIKHNERKLRPKNGIKRNCDLANPYPSPEHSPRARSISISSSCSSSSSPSDYLNHKRRCSPSPLGDLMDQPNKRSRSDETLSQPFSIGLLSPAASVGDITEVLEQPGSPSVLSASVLPAALGPTNKRKRGLPEDDYLASTKRPRNSLLTAQPLVASEPVQIPDYILQDTPFGALFGPINDIPAVGIDELNPGNTYQIDVFDYASFGGFYQNEELAPTSSTTSSQSSLHCVSDVHLPGADAASALDNLDNCHWPVQQVCREDKEPNLLPHTPSVLDHLVSEVISAATFDEISHIIPSVVEPTTEMFNSITDLGIFFEKNPDFDTQTLFNELCFSIETFIC